MGQYVFSLYDSKLREVFAMKENIFTWVLLYNIVYIAYCFYILCGPRLSAFYPFTQKSSFVITHFLILEPCKVPFIVESHLPPFPMLHEHGSFKREVRSNQTSECECFKYKFWKVHRTRKIGGMYSRCRHE